MNKLYKFVAERLIEAASEQEAKEKFANGSATFAADTNCYEACPACQGIKDGWLRECACVAEHPSPQQRP